MWNYNYTDELYHYGVLGMKWGVRRYRNKDGTLTSAGKKKRAEYSEKTKNKQPNKSTSKSTSNNTQKPKSIKELSDDELKAKIERLNLENRYQELMRSSNPPKSSEGKVFVKNVLKKSGENILPQILNYYGAKLANNLIGENVIYTNNKKKDK